MENKTLTHGSLFSGIGGFDLAAEWMGWNNVFQCEIDPFCQKVLKYHFPNTILHNDIKQTDFTIYRGRVDVLSGGFPCQPFSQAGKRKGTKDDRHLWPEMLRAIQEINPIYVVGENVYGIINWDRGLVFDKVQTDLDDCGYEVIPVILPACGKNAPHRRDRVWFVANRKCTSIGIEPGEPNNERRESDKNRGESIRQKNGEACTERIGTICKNGTTANTTDDGCKRRNGNSKGKNIGQQDNTGIGEGFFNKTRTTGEDNYWYDFPTQTPVCSGNDGIPRKLDGITFSKWRNESIKGYGNAIVPQVAYEIFKVIDKIENDF